MACPICDQKPMNCDCTPRERAMWRELQEREDTAEVVLTDAEREAVEFAVAHGETVDAAWRYALRGLLERLGGGR